MILTLHNQIWEDKERRKSLKKWKKKPGRSLHPILKWECKRWHALSVRTKDANNPGYATWPMKKKMSSDQLQQEASKVLVFWNIKPEEGSKHPDLTTPSKTELKIITMTSWNSMWTTYMEIITKLNFIKNGDS